MTNTEILNLISDNLSLLAIINEELRFIKQTLVCLSFLVIAVLLIAVWNAYELRKTNKLSKKTNGT